MKLGMGAHVACSMDGNGALMVVHMAVCYEVKDEVVSAPKYDILYVY